MPKIQQLSPHVADLIAAGEVVERPASAAKELVENAIDAGAKNITVEVQNGGMTFLRVTDDGCGMTAEDAEIAFLRHATSKLRTAEDLEAIHTLGFRGEALAAISAVSHIDLMTKTADSPFGTGLHLDAGVVTERDSVGCPDGTTIIVRDLFYNTPARMKFMKRDTVEASALVSAVSRLAIAHPEVSVRILRDGEEVLHTPGDGKLFSAVYAVLGRQSAQEMVEVSSRWESYTLTGYVSKPNATRGNRANQLFFVNGRHVRSKTMTAALEEAYRNQLMVGRFPSCVLQLTLPEHLVDVNVHPAKIEVKFLNERDLFDCIRYGVEGALEKASGRVQMKLPQQKSADVPAAPQPPAAPSAKVASPAKDTFFRTMSAEDYKAFAEVIREAPRPQLTPELRAALERQQKKPAAPEKAPEPPQRQPEAQQELPLSSEGYRIVGEVLNTYIIVEEGSNVLLIDKHAAHERILFEKFRSSAAPIVPQLLLTPILCKPEYEEAALLLENAALLGEAGFEISDYGDGVLAIRQIPADLAPEDAEQTLGELAADLKAGKRVDPSAMRDNVLHTVACKAAIKGGWHTDERELAALVKEVLSRSDLKYCPHGRPICAVLTASQLERQFKRA
ncbi:MAG: DNA mismatch repair endonuclease MutL [Oscillospiraceae bacterium]|nr:DNA mismatch repair endonuclease MutL [Oscillospiraceae bacterium]